MEKAAFGVWADLLDWEGEGEFFEEKGFGKGGFEVVEGKLGRFVFRPEVEGFFEKASGFGKLVGIAGANGGEEGGVG